MRIWKLAPADPPGPKWKGRNRGPFFVRAENESEARCLTSVEIDGWVPSKPCEKSQISSWNDYRTICEDITDQLHGYSIEGPAGVLNRERG